MVFVGFLILNSKDEFPGIDEFPGDEFPGFPSGFTGFTGYIDPTTPPIHGWCFSHRTSKVR